MRFTLIFAAAFAAAACGKVTKDEDAPNTPSPAGAPSVPAFNALSLDHGLPVDAAATGSNFATAALYVAAVDANITSYLATPVALLKQAAAATPSLLAKDTYLWSLENADALTATKTGETTWSWAIPDVLTGTSALEGNGTWQIPHRVSVTYAYTSPTAKTLTFLVTSGRPAAEKLGNGSTVTFTLAGDLATLLYVDSAESGERALSWSRGSKAGSMRGPTGAEVCWAGKDAALKNVACL